MSMSNARKKNMQVEDKRKVCLFYLERACAEFPNYRLGDILYMTLRRLAKKNNVSLGFLRRLSDDEIYKEIDFNIQNEKEDR